MSQRASRSTRGLRCHELHCHGTEAHNYGDAQCDWVLLQDDTVISRAEFNATSSRPDRVRKS